MDQKLEKLSQLPNERKRFLLRNRHAYYNGFVALVEGGMNIGVGNTNTFFIDRASAALLAKRINQALELWRRL